METVLSGKKSKSARKDANRKAKYLDKSNWLLLYLEPSDIVFWQDGILAEPNGTILTGFDVRSDITIDHNQTVLQYNRIKSSAITAWNALGYTRFKKWGLTFEDRLAAAKGHVTVRAVEDETKILGIESLTRQFWGKEFFPILIPFMDKGTGSILVALAVFDPEKTFIGY